LDILLHALSRMDGPKPRLLVIGTGEEESPLKSFCHELGLDRDVTFEGHINNQKIATIYQKIDVLVVPSVWPENSPVTISEAMASGIPVIASDIGGISELVEDGVTGFLVPLRDSHAMAERIGRLLEHPELKQEMGQAALARIQPYRLQNQVEQIVGIYQQVVTPRAEPAKPIGEVLLYDAPVPWNMALREMFQRLAEVEEKLVKRLLIGRVDLSDDDSWEAAKLLVISTLTEHSAAYALQALHRQIPILVPEDAEDLRDLCLISNGGLFYSNSEELKECLLLLLSNEGLRQRMGSNGQRFIREARTPSAVSRELP
jgi:glycosyltransferase involved in cell wall biosynthesis